MKILITDEKCPAVYRRVAHDKKKGKTTSQAEISVIRLMCKCDDCSEARKASKMTPQKSILKAP